MAYYNKLPKRPMTREEHLRRDAREWMKEEDGKNRAGYSGGRRRPDEEDKKPYGGKRSAVAPEGKRAGRAGGETFSRKSAPQERRAPKASPSPSRPPREADPRPASPAPRPAPAAPDREDSFRPSAPENLIVGRNPIREALRSGRDIEKLLVARGDLSGTAREIVAEAREQHIPVQTVERTRLDEICRGHQGMLAFASAYRYYEVEDMLADARERGEKPFLVVLDGVTDPQNLGAIIRTAACVGAHGVIVPQRRAVGLTPSAVKASAGAVEKIKVARVTNLSRTLDFLKEKGLWLYAADMSGVHYRKVDFSGAVALVIGSEGDGISRLTLEKCDYRVSLPMSGVIDSLNASVAAGVLMYAVRDYR